MQDFYHTITVVIGVSFVLMAADVVAMWIIDRRDKRDKYKPLK